MERANKTITNTIMYDLQNGAESRNDGNMTNVCRKQLFLLFPNIETIEIHTTNTNGDLPYSLSITSLLSEIKNVSFKKIMIKAIRKNSNWQKLDACSSWISYEWLLYENKFRKLYEDRSCAISLKTTPALYGYHEDTLLIQRL